MCYSSRAVGARGGARVFLEFDGGVLGVAWQDDGTLAAFGSSHFWSVPSTGSKREGVGMNTNIIIFIAPAAAAERSGAGLVVGIATGGRQKDKE